MRRIDGAVENHVAGMILDCGIGLGCHVQWMSPMVVVLVWDCVVAMVFRDTSMFWSTAMA